MSEIMKHNIPYCFTKAEIISNFSSNAQFNNWLKTRINNMSLARVRSGLYVSLDSMGQVSSNKFEIASKIFPDSFVCYHSALEYYGIANQVFNNVYVGTSKRFSTFEFNRIEYECKIVNSYIQVNNIVNENINITSLERTIIDCIDKIELSGGIEELLNAINQVRILNENKLIDVLKSYDKVFLYQKTGYILEQFKSELSLSENFFECCLNNLTNQVKYFLQNEYKDIIYNSKWKLMAPNNLKSRINEAL